jgi:hypothetical protein
MNYSVAGGQAVVARGTAVGPYLGANDGAATVNTTAAPGSGSRYDLVWVQFPDVEQGDANSVGVLGVTQGTASGSPTKPYGSVPAGALVLAEALMPTGTTRTDTGVTITQVAPWTVARGAAVPVRTQTERDALTLFDGLSVYRLDTHKIQVYSGIEWLELAPGGMPATVTAYGNGTNTITSATFAALPTNPCSVAFTNPSATRALEVRVSYGAWVLAASGDVRGCVVATGGLTITSGVGGGGAIGWGEILYTSAASGSQAHADFTCTIPAGAAAVTFTVQALRTGAGAVSLNYPTLRVAPQRFV